MEIDEYEKNSRLGGPESKMMTIEEEQKQNHVSD